MSSLLYSYFDLQKNGTKQKNDEERNVKRCGSSKKREERKVVLDKLIQWKKRLVGTI